MSQQDAASDAGTPSIPKPRWHDYEITAIDPAARTLLEKYSHIPPASIIPHVRHIRERALAVSPWGCIGQGRFLKYKLQTYPYHGPVITKLRGQSNTTFLDAGCCLGQELRYLIHTEHVPAEQLFGFDLEPGYHDVGYELFKDKDRLGAALLAGDLLAEQGSTNAESLSSIEGKMDIVHVASVLHAFDWDDMLRAAKRLVSFTKPVSGSMIVGSQVGSLKAGTYRHRRGCHYRHNDESMARFWEDVGQQTGTKWNVQSGLVINDEIKMNQSVEFADSDIRFIWFMAERV